MKFESFVYTIKKYGFYNVKHKVRKLNPREFFEGFLEKDWKPNLEILNSPDYIISGNDCCFPWIRLAYEDEKLGRWVCPGCPAENLECHRGSYIYSEEEAREAYKHYVDVNREFGLRIESWDEWKRDLNILPEDAFIFILVETFLRDVEVPEVLWSLKKISNLDFSFCQVMEEDQDRYVEETDEFITVPVRFVAGVSLAINVRKGKIRLPGYLRVYSDLSEKGTWIKIEKYSDLIRVFKGFHEYLYGKGFKLDPHILQTKWIDHLFPGQRKTPCSCEDASTTCRGCSLFDFDECESAFMRFRLKEWESFINEWNNKLPEKWKFYEEFVICPYIFPHPFMDGVWNEYIERLIKYHKAKEVLKSTFSFDVEETLEELAENPRWSEKVEAYRMYRRGIFQDDIKKHFGVTQSAISKWISKVKGELSRRMGAAYEKFRKAKLELRPDVDRVIYDGRQGKPDFVVYLKDGSVKVISSKCYYSDRKSVSIKRAEIEPEIQEALRLKAEGRKVRLFVDFYNLHDEHHEMREISLDRIPPRLLFQHT